MRRLISTLVALPLATLSASLHAQAWSLDSAVAPAIVNDVSQLLNATFVPTPSGQFLVFGDFTHISGTAAPGLARLGSDGKLDPTFAADLAADERITAIAPLTDGRSVAFVATNTRVSVVTATPPVVLPGTGGQSIDPTATATTAVTVVPVGGTLTGGSQAPGPTVSRLIRFRSDGRKDTTFTALNCDGYPQLTAMPDGRVIAWGSFRVLGQARNSPLARLNTDGTLDAAFAPSLTTAILSASAIAPSTDGSFFASGWSAGIPIPIGPGALPGNPDPGSVAVPVMPTPAKAFLVRIFANGSGDVRFVPENITTTFSMLAAQPDGSVLAGNAGYLSVNSIRSGMLDRFTLTGVRDRTYSVQIPALNGITRVLPLSGGRLAVEATVGSASVYYGGPAVFTLGVNGQLLTDWRKVPGAREGQRLLAAQADGRLLVAQGTLVVASSFYPVPYDATAPAVATIMPVFLGPTLVDPALAISPPDASAAPALSPSNGPTTPLATLPTTIVHRYPGNVSRLETDSAGRVLVAGSFTQIDGQPRAGLARFLASGALDNAFAPSASELLFVPPDGRPIVRRTAIGPIDATDGFHRYVTQVARLQNDGSVDAAFAFPANLDATKTTWLGAASDGSPAGAGRLLVAAFDPDASKEENLKLIWLGADGHRLTTLPTVFNGFTRFFVMPLAATDGTAVAGPTDLVSTLYPLGYGQPNVLDRAQLLADGRLLVAGAFSKVDGLLRPGLARLQADGTVDTAYAPDTGSIQFLGSTLPLADGRAFAFGSSITSGRWQSRILRYLADGKIDASFQPPTNTISSGARVLADGVFFSNGRRFTADGWPDLNFAPQLGYDTGTGYAYIATIATDGRLWLGGNFDRVNNQPRTALARFALTEIIGITASPVNQRVVTGRDAFLQVAIGTTQPASFRWTRDGVTLAGATSANLRVPSVSAADAGVYRAIVTIGTQTFTSDPATLTVVPSTSRLTNFSARSLVGPGSPPQVAGVVCAGAPPRNVLLRAVGRGLQSITNASGSSLMLSVPVLTLYDGAGGLVAQDRGSATAPAIVSLAARVGAFPLNEIFAPPSPQVLGLIVGSALTPTLGDGAYTGITTSGDGSSGVSLFEFYDTGSADSSVPLVRNISIRGTTAPGAGVLTAGFVIAGNGPLRLLVRGVGPALATFGLSGTIADPRLEVFSGNAGGILASNTGWANDPEVADATRRTGAFSLAAGSRDSALVVTLEPGGYTAQLSSVTNASGNALIEIYVVDF
ncbi:MAG: hypothetical protein HZA93_18330 [Verrucomicrobia bacterium]|nr:hypothetical protein [Verrucomicrobiota bacterium]